MKKYKHILCPIDLTDHSNAVVKQAIEFQQLTNAKLSIVHFVEPVPVIAYNVGTVDLQESLVNHAKEEIEKIRNNYNLEQQQIYIITEYPKRGITSFAKKTEVDLIIVGHGTHSFIETFLGSTASNVANHTPCDVFIVKS